MWPSQTRCGQGYKNTTSRNLLMVFSLIGYGGIHVRRFTNKPERSNGKVYSFGKKKKEEKKKLNNKSV